MGFTGFLFLATIFFVFCTIILFDLNNKRRIENRFLKRRLEIETKSLKYLNEVDSKIIAKLEKSNNFHIKINKSLTDKILKQKSTIDSYEVLEGKKK